MPFILPGVLTASMEVTANCSSGASCLFISLGITKNAYHTCKMWECVATFQGPSGFRKICAVSGRHRQTPESCRAGIPTALGGQCLMVERE